MLSISSDSNYSKFLPVAQAIANLSKDRSTKVGAIALGPEREILSVGYNGFPRGVDDEPAGRHQRPAKYMWTAHAEENLVAQAARNGVSLKGSTVIVTPLHPCATCARMLIQAGVVKVLHNSEATAQAKWLEEFEVASQMFKEAGVTVEKL